MRLPWRSGPAPVVDWNALRFPGPGADHVESYFIKAVSPDALRAIWLKATIYSSAREPERAVTEGWAIAFDHRTTPHRHYAAKCSVPLDEASLRPSGLGLEGAQ